MTERMKGASIRRSNSFTLTNRNSINENNTLIRNKSNNSMDCQDGIKKWRSYQVSSDLKEYLSDERIEEEVHNKLNKKYNSLELNNDIEFKKYTFNNYDIKLTKEDDNLKRYHQLKEIKNDDNHEVITYLNITILN